ncbi:MAG: hypothetical protein GC204_03680 [Chloroflexi bacterium]|nr:hypothetical protein [Chloroflexota bacterium]
MTCLSRREILAAMLAARGAAKTAPDSASPLPFRTDPLIAMTAAWRAADARRHALETDWQDAETRLSQQARRLGLTLAAAIRSALPAAKRLRRLARQLAAADRNLVRKAHRIRDTPAMSGAGALAKARLGLTLQGEGDWRSNAFDLLRAGLAELDALQDA